MTVRFEHFALNLAQVREFSSWYIDHLGCRVVAQAGPPKHTTFLADASGRTFVEVYDNQAAPADNFAAREPLTFHFAFQTDDAARLRDLLLREGATLVEEQRPEEGTHLVMLRDPWGLPLQLCQRKVPYPTREC